MKRLFYGFLFSIVCISAFSCKKDWEDPSNNNQPKGPSHFCAIDKIYHEDSSHYSQYIYNENYDVGHKEYIIDSIKTYNNNNLEQFVKYHYYDNPKEKNYRRLSKIEYFVQGQVQSYISIVYSTGSLVESYTFHEMNNGTDVIVKQIIPYYNYLGNVDKNVYYEPGANGLLEEKYEHRFINYNPGKVTRIEEYVKVGSEHVFNAVITYAYNSYKNTFALAYMSPLYITPNYYDGNIISETKTDTNEKVIYSIVNNYAVDQNSSSILTDITGKTTTYSSDSSQTTSKDFYSFICRKR